MFLPDGTALELDDGATGADAARAIGEGLARAALGDRGRRGAARPRRAAARRRQDRDRHRRATTDGAVADPPRRRARAGHGGDGALPGREDLDRPADRGRLLLRLRVPGGRQGLRRRLRAHRGEDARARQGRRALRARRRAGGRGDRALPRRGPGLQGRADRGPRRATQGVETVSLYRNGPFTDLCRGPHGPSTKRIKAFKLTSVAGAYWRGDAEPPDAHPHLRHRLPLEGGPRGAPASGSRRRARATTASSAASWTCSCSPTLSPGSPFWLPNGTHIWNELTQLWRDENVERGYTEVRTPILYDVELWKQSGHWDVYRDHMYFTDVEDRPMGLKPMNCPAHVRSTSASGAPTATCRSATPSRAWCTATSRAARCTACCACATSPRTTPTSSAPRSRSRRRCCAASTSASSIYDRFGFEPRLELSTRPEKRVGSDEMWDRAEAALERALEKPRPRVRAQRGRRRLLRPEDRPPHDRLDRPLVAARHRPARLLHARAVRAHLHRRRQRRAPPGDDPPRADGLLRALHRHPDRALRRRVPALAGAGAGGRAADRRPPRRLRARGGRASCASTGMRAEVDERTESIGKKIRDAELRKVPYMLVVGDKEEDGRRGGGPPPPRGRPRALPVTGSPSEFAESRAPIRRYTRRE